MPQGKKNNHNYRGRGRGGGHTSPGRGRGGGPRDDISTSNIINGDVPATQPHPRSRYAHTNEDTDVVIQQWAEPMDASGNGNGNRNGYRKRGTQWRGGVPKSRSGAGTPSRGAETPQRGNVTPRWGGGWSGPEPGFRGRGQGTSRGTGIGRGRGRGRGIGGAGSRGQDIVLIGEDFVGSAHRPHPRSGVGRGNNASFLNTPRRLGKDAPLSNLLSRPLLRPVVFVRPTLTSSFLFQEPEDVLEPASHVADADTTEESHVPTADRVARLFHHNASDSNSKSHDDGGLEEVDFADLAQVRAEVDAIAHGQATTTKQGAKTRRDREGIEEIDFADLALIRAEVDAAVPLALEAPRDADAIPEERFTGVYNHVKEATQAQSNMDVDVIVDNQLDVIQQMVLPFASGPTADDAFESRPSIDISNTTSIHESRTQGLDTIPVEEKTPTLTDAPHTQSPPEPRPEFTTAPTGTDDREDPPPLFFVDTEPTRRFTPRSASDVILVDRAGHGDTLGDYDDDEERIVYVAPHPRSSRVSPIVTVPRVELPKTSMLTGTSTTASEEQGVYKGEEEEEDAMPARAGLEEGDETNRGSTASTSSAPAASSSRQTEVRPLRWRQRQGQKNPSQPRFGALGAMVSEARLREADAKEKRHPQWATRRKEDSDIDWGTDDDEGQERGADVAEDTEEGEGDDGMDEVSNGLGGMSLDPDLDLDLNAMQGFVESMSAEKSHFVTMDDLEDEARMRQEDEESQGGPEGSSDSEIGDEDEEDEEEEDDDEEEAFNAEEAMLIAESESDDELSDDSDEELTPRASFQARLRKVRERSHSQHPESVRHQSDDDDDDDEDAPELEILPGTRSADDESFMAGINKMLEENSYILSGRGQKQKKGKGKGKATSHREGGAETFVDDPEFTTPVAEKNKKKKKGGFGGAYFAADLEAQWARDREKKAERRRERREEMLRDALDPLYLTPRHKGGQGGGQKKAMRAAVRLDPSEAHAIAPLTLLGVDASTEEGIDALESYVRAFAFGASANNSYGRGKGKGKGKSSESVAFPPMDKDARAVVHALAQAFGLKSVSKGTGGRRYTTLIRTTRVVDEGRVRGVVKRFTGGGKGKGGKNGNGGAPKPWEGEVVGKEAPKIGQGNVGFKMLASMGWTEGERIGSVGSVGIDDPLTAKIKHSKLGLGATR